MKPSQIHKIGTGEIGGRTGGKRENWEFENKI